MYNILVSVWAKLTMICQMKLISMYQLYDYISWLFNQRT